MAEPTTASRGNPIGVASLAFGTLLLLAGIVSQVIMQVMPVGDRAMDLAFWVMVASAGLATILGTVGLLTPRRPRGAAIFGTVIGASHLVLGMVGIVVMELVFAGFD